MFLIFALALTAVVSLIVVGCIGSSGGNVEQEMRNRHERVMQTRNESSTPLASRDLSAVSDSKHAVNSSRGEQFAQPAYERAA